MESAEVLKALEAELRAIDTKRAELSRAIETIRRIIVVGKPETQRVEPSQQNTKLTVADRAIAYIKKSGGKAKMTDIVTAVADPTKDRHSQYGTIYGALRNRSEDEGSGLTLAEPGVWQVS